MNRAALVLGSFVLAACNVRSAPSKTIVVSVATFDEGSVLDECIDVDISPSADFDAGADWQKKLSNRANATLLPKACTEQFADREVLATCTLAARATSRGTVVGFEDRYYNLASLERSDAYLQQCLQMGGNWSAIPHDSDAYRNAQRRHAERTLEKLAR